LRKLFVLAAVAALCIAFAATAFGATRVRVGDNWFVKPGNGSKTVSKGTVVKFKNVGDNPHSVVFKKGPVLYPRRMLLPGATYKRKFTRKGRYRIICDIHSGQRMTLRVR
jgi:plastocyanin